MSELAQKTVSPPPSDILFVDKPAGVATHATEAVSVSRSPAEGLVEHLSRISQRKLLVCHRLDKETSGALLFAVTPEAASRLSELFLKREMQKTYLFVTDRTLRSEAFRRASHIEKRGSNFVSSTEREANAVTEFTLLKKHKSFSLWQAKPETGKPHQIRLHAADEGMPILGDLAHGGSAFPCLMLHSLELSFQLGGQTLRHQTAAPIFFSQLELLENPRLVSWLAAFDRRRRWLASRSLALNATTQMPGQAHATTSDTWRWVHSEGGALRVEQLGPQFSLQWFANDPMNERDQCDLRALIELTNIHDWRLHIRNDRGRNPNKEDVMLSRADLPARWHAWENGLRFEFRADCGLSSGLFLDQRANRRWLRGRAADKRVLNLFCYTGGFSVCAAAGGASQTVSVDLSRAFLDWTKTNFILNDVQLDGHEFRAMDARDYLNWARKKGLRFDLIVCDPPSFGRSDRGVFRIEKDISGLVASLDACLGDEGRILFCCNYEGWDEIEFIQRLRAAIAAGGLRLRLEPAPPADWDFELPREPRIMKCAILARI